VRIEAGTVGISTNDLRALLALYGMGAGDQMNDLLDLARRSRKRMWWSDYRDVLSGPYLEFIGFEAEASKIRYYHPTVVPGLLQSEAYTRAMIPSSVAIPREPEDVERLIDVRLTRISDVLGRDEPPQYTAVLDEAVVRRMVGGPAVMRDQLRHLADLAAADYIELRWLPFQAGAHPGLYGSFALLDFADAADDTVLYLENAPTDMVLRDRASEISTYEAIFEKLVEVSYDETETLTALNKIADSLD
ncbi:MAG TPA: DUF5753 domain-containing protein, partial [Micromonosporaceae bacterium]|nr:DUF5753 domain-containing protein [Micromonosporaceae bacterium]